MAAKKKKAKRGRASSGTKRAVARTAAAAAAAPGAFPALLQSGRHVFQLDGARACLTLKRPFAPRQLQQLLSELKLELDDGRVPGDELLPKLLRMQRSYWVRTLDRSVLQRARVKAIVANGNVVALWPVYRRTDIPGARGLMSPRLGALIVRSDLADRFAKDLSGSGLHVEKRFRVRGLRYMTSGDLNDARIFDVAAKLAAGPVVKPVFAARFAAAVPVAAAAVAYDWVPFVSPFAVVPVDPSDLLFDTGGGDVELAAHQWYLKRIGARYAWGMFGPGQPGAASVSVLMFDRGVDQTHADFGAIQQIELFNGAPDPLATAPFDAHGTELAGIVAAQHDDGNALAGIAPGCPFTSLRYNDTIDPFSVGTAAIASAIDYAGTIDNSVLLIGMDAGAGVLTDASVQTSINNNNKSLIVVAAGNDTGSGSSIGYGAVQPHVLIAAGYEQTDAADRNGRWLAEALPLVGSKFGPEVSVAAPAADIMTTTWVSGMSNKYTVAPGLRGTSLAAAQAAGMAALVWSLSTTLTPAQVRTQLEQTAAKCGVDRPSNPGVEQTAYRTVAGYPNGIWNDHLGYGSIDASAVLLGTTPETDAATTDMEVARVIIRDNPSDLGLPEPSSGSLVTQCDIIVSTDPAHVATGVIAAGGAEDVDFSSKVLSAVNQVGSASAYYVFVRVVNIGPAPARCVRVTASLAACATSFMYPNSWDDPTGAITVNALNDAPPADLSYLQGPLPVGGIFVARLAVPVGSDFTGFSGHACCVARVVAANDVNFTRASVSGASAQRLFNNLAQRNLSVV